MDSKRAVKLGAAMRLFLVVTLMLSLLAESALAGLGSDKSQYVGGTVASVPKGTEGIISTEDTKKLTFKAQKASLEIPYDKVTGLEYGQHAGRRVGTTIALGVTTLGIGALPVLFSKKRRHYLTIAYADSEGVSQAGVFEVGKGAIRTLLASLSARTGKQVQYEDEEAKKAGSK